MARSLLKPKKSPLDFFSALRLQEILTHLFHRFCSAAAVLSTACKPLLAAVAASKWPPYSSLPFIAPDGTVREPISGRFSVICHPEEGEGGIRRAIRRCEEGGSILLLEGIYHLTRTLRIWRCVHLFGRGRAELRGTVPDFIISSTSSFASLDRLRIDNEAEGDSWTLFVASTCHIRLQRRLRLQGCGVSSLAENSRTLLTASGPYTLVDALGCTFRGGGGGGVEFAMGASGRIEGCDIRGFSRGSGVKLWSSGTSPLVSRNTIRDCRWGVIIDGDVDPSWSLGIGNVFTNCAKGDVGDWRPHPPSLPPPGPPPSAQ